MLVTVGARRFAGVDQPSVAVWLGFVVAFGVIATVVTWFFLPRLLLPCALILAALAAAAVATLRYELVVDASGIEWRSLTLWLFQTRRERYLLDAKVSLYLPWDADRAEGVSVVPVRVWEKHEQESPCFGPYFKPASIDSLYTEIRQAIESARRELPPTPTLLRCALLAPHGECLDLAAAKRDTQGRLREIRVRTPFGISGLEVAPASWLELNGEDFLDPRREDRLKAVRTGAAVRTPLGFEVPAETRLWLDESGHIDSVSGQLGLLTHDGFPIDGNKPIQFDGHGALRAFTLGRDFELGGFVLPEGTHAWTFDKFLGNGPRWLCRIARAVALPDIEVHAGESLCFDKARKKLLHVILDVPRPLGRWTLGRGHVDVRPSGHVRRYRALRLGLLTRARRD
jgi:hypothetical protein